MPFMTRHCLAWIIAAAAALAAGCWDRQTLTQFGDEFDKQTKEKARELDAALKSVDKAISDSAERSAQEYREFRNALEAKYVQDHRPERLVFFGEDARPAPAAPGSAAAAPGPRVVAPAKEIQADVLSERTLTRRGLRLLWKLPLDGTGVRSADLSEGYLYVVTQGNLLYSIDMRSGLTRWMYDIGRRPDSAPGFNNQYVVLSAGDIIRVIDKAIGKEKTRTETNIQPSTRPFCTQNYFVYGSWDGEVSGFEFGDRYPRWTFHTQSPVFASPMLFGTFAYAVSDDGGFSKYNMGLRISGAKVELGARPVGDPLGTTDYAYVGTESGEVVAIKTGEAKIVWRHSCDGRPLPGLWLSESGNVLYYSGSDDGLHALTASTGKERWLVPGGVQPVGLAGETMFVLRNDRSLCKVDAPTGKIQWAEPIAPFVSAVPQMESEIIFLISPDGQIYAVAPKK
jgi:outer membrane protein assembly factor BamB